MGKSEKKSSKKAVVAAAPAPAPAPVVAAAPAKVCSLDVGDVFQKTDDFAEGEKIQEGSSRQGAHSPTSTRVVFFRVRI